MKLVPASSKVQTTARLQALSRSINDRETVLGQFRDQMLSKWREFLAEILLQGRDLLEARGLLEHGQWETWLAKNCPRSVRTARRYILLASNRTRVADFEKAGSLRKCLDIIDPEPPITNAPEAPRSWPAYIEGINRFSKCFGFLEKHPLDKWPASSQEELRTKLEPVAKALWPDKFNHDPDDVMP